MEDAGLAGEHADPAGHGVNGGDAIIAEVFHQTFIGVEAIEHTQIGLVRITGLVLILISRGIQLSS